MLMLMRHSIFRHVKKVLSFVQARLIHLRVCLLFCLSSCTVGCFTVCAVSPCLYSVALSLFVVMSPLVCCPGEFCKFGPEWGLVEEQSEVTPSHYHENNSRGSETIPGGSEAVPGGRKPFQGCALTMCCWAMLIQTPTGILTPKGTSKGSPEAPGHPTDPSAFFV